MSRKRRKRSTVAVQNPAPAQDGYTNSLAYLGEASTLSKANDYERHSISNEYELLTVLYRENWLAARIIDTPCEDMTRSWYSLASEIDQEKLDELAKLETKHSIKQEITNAIRWGRLYGGAAAVMVIKGQEDMLDQPLDYDMLQPGCFRGLIVLDKVRGIFPSIDLEEDMDDPEFGYPAYYEVVLDNETAQLIRIHHSRLLLFRGRQLPINEEINADYWGASEIEHVYEELQKRNSSSANIAQLIFQANVAAMKISDYGEVLGMGTQAQRQQLYRTIEEMNRLRTSFGIALMGTEDSYEQHPYSFAGVAEVYETFMMDMAGAAEIPATKLFGRAPQGMNATGESDMKNYYEMISQLQERVLRPALEKLLPVMAMSLWGEIPEDLEIVFEPLGTTTPSERAEIMGQSANPIIQAFSAGIISQKTALLELRESGKPINAWTNITDEDIDNAEDQVDTGEMGGMDPMGGMGGMMPPEAQTGQEPMPEGAAEEEPVPGPDEEMVAPEAVPEGEQTENDSSDRIGAAIARLKSIRVQDPERLQRVLEKMQKLQEKLESSEDSQAEDGGPGSGPRPGYHKKGLFHRKEPVPMPQAKQPVQGKQAKQPVQQSVQQAPVQKGKAAKVAKQPVQGEQPVQPTKKSAKKQVAKQPVQQPTQENLGNKGKPGKPGKEVPEKAPKEKSKLEQRRATVAKKIKENPFRRNVDPRMLSTKQKIKASIGGLASGIAGAIGSFGKQGVHGLPSGNKGSAGQAGGTKSVAPSEVKSSYNPNEISKHTNSGDIPEIVKSSAEKRNKEEVNQDGGPGSGPRPGYHKKASLAERVKFLTNPAGHLESEGGPRSNAEVHNQKKEAEEWANLTTHQRLAGTAKENRHIRQVKRQVAKAAAKGDIDEAKRIVNANKHYWKNDVPSAMKLQSETLQRQKAEKRGYMHDVIEDGGPGSGNFGHAGRPGERGGSAPENGAASSSSRSSAIEKLTGPRDYEGFFGSDPRYGRMNPGTTGKYRTKKDPKTGYTIEPSKEEKRRQKYEFEVKHGNQIDPLNAGISVPRTIGELRHMRREDPRFRPSEKKIKNAEALAKDLEWTLESKDRRDFVDRGIQVMENWEDKVYEGDFPITEYNSFMSTLREEARSLKEFESIEKECGKIDPKSIEPFDDDEEYEDAQREFNAQKELMGISPQSSTKSVKKNTAPVDNGPQESYNKSKIGWRQIKANTEVDGPKASRKFIDSYLKKNPDVRAEIPKYMGVRQKIANFGKDNPNADPGTYDAITGKPKNVDTGFCVTFHQNNTGTDNLGGYTDEDYAAMCAIAMKELGADGVNIGYFGNPEVSFTCNDEKAAKEFAIKHNQHSVYNAATGRTLKNKKYNPKTNPINL